MVSFWVQLWWLLQANPEVPKDSAPGLAKYKEHYMQVLVDVPKRKETLELRLLRSRS